MSSIRLHHTTDAIQALTLPWQKLLGESRSPGLAQTEAWFRLAARLCSPTWQPIVIQANFDSRPIGLLPLLAHRKRSLWASPACLLGIGNGIPVGSQPTATWLQIGRWLNSSSNSPIPRPLEILLGPFPHGTGSASRLTTAFDQVRLPKLQEFSQDKSGTLMLNQLPSSPSGSSQTPPSTQSSRPSLQWQLSETTSRGRGGDQTPTQLSDWLKLHQSHSENSRSQDADSFDWSRTDLLEHASHELGQQGLCHCLVGYRDSQPVTGILLWGPKSKPVVIASHSSNQLNASAQQDLWLETLQILHQHGFGSLDLHPQLHLPPGSLCPTVRHSYLRYATRKHVVSKLKSLYFTVSRSHSLGVSLHA